MRNAGRKCSIDRSERSWKDTIYYSFAEMRPYLGPTVPIKDAIIDVTEDLNYDSEHIAEMEPISYLWRDYEISIFNDDHSRIVAEHFYPILNSPTILQCRLLKMINANFKFKNYKILFTVKVMEMNFVY